MHLIDVIERLHEHMNDAVLIAEAEPLEMPGPKIVWANQAFTRMTGFSTEEIIGQTPRILQGPETDQET